MKFAYNENPFYHNHFDLGQAPYRLVGIWSMPCISLAESHPQAYSNELKTKPSACAGQCDHCGTAIVHHFIIADASGKEFSVGSSCIEKLGDVALISQAEAARRKRAKAERAEKRQRAVLQKRQQLQVQEQAERERNAGLTDREVLVRRLGRLEEAQLADREEVVQEIAAVLCSSGGWGKGLVDSLLSGRSISASAKRISAEILAKQHGRKNSKAYQAALPVAEELVYKTLERLEAIKQRYQGEEVALRQSIFL